MNKREQKQKNDLVFKILKSMDPFIPNNADHNFLRNRLNQILISAEQSHNKSADSNSLLELSASTEKTVRFLHNLQNDKCVYNYLIESLSPETQRKMKELREKEERMKKQMQDKKLADRVKKQLLILQGTVNSRFSKNSQPLKFCSSKKYSQPLYNSQKSPHENIQNWKQQNDMIGSKLFGITSTYSRITESPIKMQQYRHEIDPIQKSARISAQTNRQSSQIKVNKDSRMKFNGVIRSKSALFGSELKKSKDDSEKMSQFSNKTLKKDYNKILMNPQKKIQIVKKTPMKIGSSEKLLKDAHELDVEVTSSLLFRKMTSRNKFI